LHRDDAVIRRVALVKAVMREAFPIREDGLGLFPGQPVLYRAFDKLHAVGGNLFFFLFGDGRAQLI